MVRTRNNAPRAAGIAAPVSGGTHRSLGGTPNSAVLLAGRGLANRAIVLGVILQFRHEPACLILSRQALPTLDRTKYGAAAGLAKGAYVLADAPGGAPEVLLLLATGSEVALCVAAHDGLTLPSSSSIPRLVSSEPLAGGSSRIARKSSASGGR